MQTDDSTPILPLPPDVETRDIEGFPGYRVGRDGAVWSCHPHNGRPAGWHLLKSGLNADGYLMVSLRYGGRGHTRKVHSLVLMAFVGLSPRGFVGCHGNGIKTDNRLENLRWDSRAGNEADKRLHGTDNRGERCGHAKLTEAQVRTIIELLADGQRQNHIAHLFGITAGAVGDIARGISWTQIPRPRRLLERQASIRQQHPLTQAQRVAIVACFEAGERLTVIASQFGIHRSTVSRIVNRKRCRDTASNPLST